MSNEAMKNTGVKNEVGTALMWLAFHIKQHGIDLNTIADCYEMTDSRQPRQVESDVAVIKSAILASSSEMTDSRQPQRTKSDVAVIKPAISTSSSELQEIINVVNNVVTSTTNGTSSVENLEDLKAFLNQAIPAWQNAMQNQTVFQQQFYRFPSHM